jgi:hypothetical protein
MTSLRTGITDRRESIRKRDAPPQERSRCRIRLNGPGRSPEQMNLLARVFAPCVLIGALAACEPPRDEVVDWNAAQDADAAPPATFEDTEAALRRGALSYPQEAWLQNIDGWLERLEGVEIAHRDDIVGHLRELRSEVQREPFDIQRVADLLDQLGDYVRAAGEDAGDPRAERLGRVLNEEAERMRAEVAGPPGLPARPFRPGAPGATAPGEPDEVIEPPPGQP